MIFGNKQINENDFPKISRARLKIVDSESSEIGDGTTSAPTEEEKNWFTLLKSTAPEAEKLPWFPNPSMRNRPRDTNACNQLRFTVIVYEPQRYTSAFFNGRDTSLDHPETSRRPDRGVGRMAT